MEVKQIPKFMKPVKRPRVEDPGAAAVAVVDAENAVLYRTCVKTALEHRAAGFAEISEYLQERVQSLATVHQEIVKSKFRLDPMEAKSELHDANNKLLEAKKDLEEAKKDLEEAKKAFDNAIVERVLKAFGGAQKKEYKRIQTPITAWRGREDCIERVREHVRKRLQHRDDDDKERHKLMMISGPPGQGKTRAIDEIAAILPKMVAEESKKLGLAAHDVYPVLLQFNGYRAGHCLEPQRGSSLNVITAELGWWIIRYLVTEGSPRDFMREVRRSRNWDQMSVSGAVACVRKYLELPSTCDVVVAIDEWRKISEVVEPKEQGALMTALTEALGSPSFFLITSLTEHDIALATSASRRSPDWLPLLPFRFEDAQAFALELIHAASKLTRACSAPRR